MNRPVMASPDYILLAVNGTLMRGLELNSNLLALGAEFECEAYTSPHYFLWSIDDRYPAMQRAITGGKSIALEIWRVPCVSFSQLLLGEPPGLVIGRITLVDGSSVLGVLGEAYCCIGKRDITVYGGWRAYIHSIHTPSTYIKSLLPLDHSNPPSP